MMAKVDTTGWKQFRIGDLFGSAKHGNWVNPKLLDEYDAGYCIVSASTVENGIGSIRYACFDAKNLIPAHVITWGKQSPFFAYQAEPTISGQGVYFYEVGALSERAVLFLCAVMQSVIASRYNYQDCLIGEKCDDEVIFLPATSTGEPDWVYMDAYMSEIMQKEEVYASHLASLTAEAVADGHKLDTSGWKAFRLTDLFVMRNTKSIVQQSVVFDSGDVPYVTSQAVDNGVAGYISCPDAWLEPGNCLLIGGKTSTVFYQALDFCSNDSHNIACYAKESISDKAYLFLQSILSDFLRQHYSWGNSLSMKSLVLDEIYLPVTSDGQPDWAWMEQYMQQQIDKAEALVEHLDAVWN